MARIQGVLQLIATVVAPLTLITALMFYMGWIRTNALFQYFGIDAALLRFSNQDFLLRSVESLWAPLIALLALGVAVISAHGAVKRALPAGRRLRALRKAAAVLAWFGLALALLGGVEVVAPGRLPFPTISYPLCLGVGVGLAAYGSWLYRGIHASGKVTPAPVVLPRLGVASTTLVCLLIVLSLFWAASEYATAVGRGRALTFAGALDNRPGVIVYSEKRLFIGEGVVTEERLPQGNDNKYRFRYRGLRLFSASGDRLFILPDGWRPGEGDATMLVLDSTIRIELSPGTGA